MGLVQIEMSFILGICLLSSVMSGEQQPAPMQHFRADPPPPYLQEMFHRCDANNDALLSWSEIESCWYQFRPPGLQNVRPPLSPRNPDNIDFRMREQRPDATPASDQ